MKNIHRIFAVAIGAALGLPAQAVAPAPPPSTQAAERAVAIPAAPLPERGAPLLGVAVAGDRLDGERGKADTTTYEARLGGVVASNSATNVATGANSIDSGSFANMAGLPVVIQNTGANVLIQNSTIVNIQFR